MFSFFFAVKTLLDLDTYRYSMNSSLCVFFEGKNIFGTFSMKFSTTELVFFWLHRFYRFLPACWCRSRKSFLSSSFLYDEWIWNWNSKIRNVCVTFTSEQRAKTEIRSKQVNTTETFWLFFLPAISHLVFFIQFFSFMTFYRNIFQPIASQKLNWIFF